MSSASSNGLDQMERDDLLRRFVPVQMFSYSSVRRMKEQEIGLRRVAIVYVCSQCDYQTSNTAHLVRHNRTHTGEKPFQCETCQKSFSQNSALNSHMRTHQEVRERPSKKFECDICDYKAKTKQNRDRHRLIHIGDAPYRCYLCEYKAQGPSFFTVSRVREIGCFWGNPVKSTVDP